MQTTHTLCKYSQGWIRCRSAVKEKKTGIYMYEVLKKKKVYEAGSCRRRLITHQIPPATKKKSVDCGAWRSTTIKFVNNSCPKLEKQQANIRRSIFLSEITTREQLGHTSLSTQYSIRPVISLFLAHYIYPKINFIFSDHCIEVYKSTK